MEIPHVAGTAKEMEGGREGGRKGGRERGRKEPNSVWFKVQNTQKKKLLLHVTEKFKAHL